MISKLLLALVLLHAGVSSGQGTGFALNGFQSGDLELDGTSFLTSERQLLLSNGSDEMQAGYAFYPNPISLNSSNKGSGFSFSTTFVFGIISKLQNMSVYGLTFIAAGRKDFPGSKPRYFGLFNETNKENTTDVFAVELDTLQNTDLGDIDDNHVGIDINGLVSNLSHTAGYYPDGGSGKFKELILISGRAMQVWVDYNGTTKWINVTLAPLGTARPSTPLLSLQSDLSPVINETMYVGFSATTTFKETGYHYILGWSFRMNGPAQELVLSKLPKLPRVGKKPISKMLTVGVPLLSVFSLAVLISGSVYIIRRKRKFAEVLEDWELNYGPQRFKYKDLYIATRGFRDQELLGTGGFGSVYRGILPSSKMEIAVKRISHDSRQGIREFVAEISSIGRLRHRNLVTLLGYCRRKGELLLVYDYMPNGSLDKYLFNQFKVTLNWNQRFRIIKGVASGLLYLHEGWELVVIHRDVKSSNVLLDAELNGRLGDFGLARLYDHGSDPQTTHVVGTLGYLAPENYRTRKATTATDVFAFGAFLLEVATGRRPIEAKGTEDVILAEWVFSCWSKGGKILEARDPKLCGQFHSGELELVLKLGLLCSHPDPRSRPTMRQVVQYLEGDMPMQDLPYTMGSDLNFTHEEGFDGFATTYSSSTDKGISASSSITNSFLSGGR